MPIVTPEDGRTGLMYLASWKAKTEVCRVLPPSQVFEDSIFFLDTKAFADVCIM